MNALGHFYFVGHWQDNAKCIIIFLPDVVHLEHGMQTCSALGELTYVDYKGIRT